MRRLVVGGGARAQVAELVHDAQAVGDVLGRDEVRRHGDARAQGAHLVRAAGGHDDGVKIIYRHYATLFFVFVVEETESEK